MSRKSTRRSSGEGSVHKVKDRDLWRAEVQLGVVDGKKKRQVAYGKTRKEALDALKKKMDVVPVTSSGLSLNDVVDQWINRADVKETTLAEYKRVIKLHIKPFVFACTSVKEITPASIEQFYRTLKDSKRTSRTIQHVHVIIRSALKIAARNGAIQSNPADLVDPPRHRKKSSYVPTVEDIQKFLTVAKDHRLYPLFVLAFDTGMRQGELFGLHWEDVDLEDRRVRIHQQVITVNNKPKLSSTKTKAGERVIMIGQMAYEALKSIEQKSGIVFPTSTGKLQKKTPFRRSFKLLLERAGLPDTPFHSFTRHGSATLLLASNVPLKIVSDRLGHSSVSFTADTYQHVLKGMQKAAVDAVDQAFQSNTDPTQRQR